MCVYIVFVSNLNSSYFGYIINAHDSSYLKFSCLIKFLTQDSLKNHIKIITFLFDKLWYFKKIEHEHEHTITLKNYSLKDCFF